MAIHIPVELWEKIIEKIHPNYIMCGECDAKLTRGCDICKTMYANDYANSHIYNIIHVCKRCKKDVCQDCLVLKKIDCENDKYMIYKGCSECSKYY